MVCTSPRRRRLFAAVLCAAAGVATSTAANFTCAAQDLDDACTALGALYAATDGAKWSNNDGWAAAAAGNATSYCTFWGVTCSGSGGVAGLALARNGLVGTLPDAMGALTSLAALDLSDNTLSGLIPPALLDVVEPAAKAMVYGDTTVVFWPQNDNAVLEGRSVYVSDLASILPFLDLFYFLGGGDPLVTTYVLQSHVYDVYTKASFQYAMMPATPAIIVGDTGSCFSNTGPQNYNQYGRCTIDAGGPLYEGYSHTLFTMRQGGQLVLRNLAILRGVGTAAVVNSGSFAAENCLFLDNSGGTGGAVYTTGPAAVSNSIFLTNSATLGAAIYTLSSLSIVNTTFEDNQATNGAIYAAGSGAPPLMSLANCVFTNNTATQVAAVALNGFNLVATNTSFTANSASSDGGAVYISATSVAALSNCSFDGNVITNSDPFIDPMTVRGAALYVSGGAVNLTGCALRGNVASGINGGYGGSIFADAGASATLTDCVVSGNFATMQGGALYCSNTTIVIAGSVLENNTADAGGALAISGGSAAFNNTRVVNNTATGSDSQGGCLLANDDAAAYADPALLLENTTFANCSVRLLLPALNAPGQSYVTAFGTGSGGGVYLTASAAANVTLRRGSSFGANAARSGAGIFVYGPVALSIADSSFSANAAEADGGALNVQAPVALPGQQPVPGLPAVNLASSVFNGNSAAASGGVAVLRNVTAWSAADSVFVANAAHNGAVVNLYSAGLPNAAPAFALANVSFVNNSAFAGALLFHDSPNPVTPPACARCTTLNNTQSNSGALPASFNATLSVLSAQSGQPLPAFNVTLFDVDGNVVNEWPGLSVSISAGSFAGLSGATTQLYNSGAASFSSLAVSDAVNASRALTYTLSSPSLPSLNGASGTVLAVVLPCGALQVFDAAALRCQCAAGAFLNVTATPPACQACGSGSYSPAAGAVATCTTCPVGSYSAAGPADAGFTRCSQCAAGLFLNVSTQLCESCPLGTYNPTPGAVTCTVNPPGFTSVSATNFSTNVSLAGVRAAAFGATQAAAVTSSLASVLGVPAEAVSLSVADAAPSRRLLQQALTLAAVVATQGQAAARVRSVMAAPAGGFGPTLLATLQASGDPVLSGVSSVAATPPAEATLTMASQACAPVRACTQPAHRLARRSLRLRITGHLHGRIAARLRALRRQRGVALCRRHDVRPLRHHRGARQRVLLRAVP